jgi:hypothetical protein
MPDPTRLHAIAGRWATAGEVLEEPPVPVVGTDVYDVLDGGHFLVHHVDVTVGGHPVRAIEIIGEPVPAGDGYMVRSFDNQGNVELMQLTIDDDGVFHFAGGPDVAQAAQPEHAGTARVRSTLRWPRMVRRCTPSGSVQTTARPGNSGWTSRSPACRDHKAGQQMLERAGVAIGAHTLTGVAGR